MAPPDVTDGEPEDADVSPTPGAQQSDGELRPLGGARQPQAVRPPPQRREDRVPEAPEEPSLAPGQELPGSWPYIRAIMAADKVFAALLIIMTLQTLYLFSMGSWVSAVISGAILWGVLTLQRWGYLLAMGLTALFVGAMVIILAVTSVVSARAGLFGAVAFTMPIAVGVFTLVVLYTRREHFS